MDAFYCQGDLVRDVGRVKSNNYFICQPEACLEGLKPSFDETIRTLRKIGVVAREFDVNLGARTQLGLWGELECIIRQNQNVRGKQRNFITENHSGRIWTRESQSDEVQTFVYDVALELGHDVEFFVSCG